MSLATPILDLCRWEDHGDGRAVNECALWDVVEEHLDEAGFLWGHWEPQAPEPLRLEAASPIARFLAA